MIHNNLIFLYKDDTALLLILWKAKNSLRDQEVNKKQVSKQEQVN